MYHAVVIEESLNDKKVLENFRILNTKIDEDWHLHILEIENIDEAISRLQPAMVKSDNFYFHIYDEGQTLVIVFRDKVFRVNPLEKETWKEVIEYGSKELNIPVDQLDFFPTKISDEPLWLSEKY